MESIPLTREAVEAAVCVVLITDHSTVDYELVQLHAASIVDTRGTMRAYLGGPLREIPGHTSARIHGEAVLLTSADR